ncbi:MAG TPA: VWA domain-containing protein [Thermoanaerobaculia bacterium]|nr:VWA domain-containing protein [Thermoanaerobaculia bacterium]
MRAFLSALSLFLFTLGAAAQMRESITVSYVEVPVQVVDRSGNAVRGLTRANFEIIDAGTRRTITGFDAVDFAAARQAELPSSRGVLVPSVTPSARRNFLLVFDLSYSSPNAMTRAKEAARKFVTQMASAQDLIGVATVDVALGFRVLYSFTTDRAVIDAAIADPRNFRAVDPLGLAGGSPQKEVEDALYDDSRKGASGTPKEENLQYLQQTRADDEYKRSNIDREINLLAGLAKTLRSVRGQKHLVLLSEGFDARLVQGHDASLDRQMVADNNLIERGQGYLIDNDRRYGSAASMTLVDRMADVAKRSGVVFDTIDIAGIRTNVDAREGYQTGSAKKTNEGLHLLSDVTGGTVFKNSNNLGDDFQRVLKTEDVVYVLSFQAPASKPGTFHDIKVKLVDVPGARAIARAGYYEAGGEGGEERTLSDAEIIMSDIPEDGVHVASLAVPFPTADTNSQVPVILEIDGKDVSLVSGNTATLEIFTYAFDENGKVRDSLYQRAALDLNKVGATLRTTGVKYYATLSLPPGKYAVKTLVRVAESERKGYARTDVVVPEKNEMAVSQPLFQDQEVSWVMVKGASHDRSHAAYPFTLNGASFVPSAAVHVKSGQPERFVVFVQNAAPDELTVDTHPDAKPIAQLRSDTGSKLVYELPPNPSTSVLHVTVNKRGTRDSRSASVSIVR